MYTRIGLTGFIGCDIIRITAGVYRMENQEFMSLVLQELSKLRDGQQGLQKGLSDVREDVNSLREDMVNVRGEVASVREDVNSVREDVNSVREDVTGLREDMVDIRGKVTSLREDMADVKQRVTKIEIIQENVTNKKIDALGEGFQGVNEKFRRLDELEEKVEDIRLTVSVLKALTAKK